MLSIITGIGKVFIMFCFFPMFSLFMFITDVIFNDSLLSFVFYTSISIYLISVVGTALLIILKIVNIEVKSDKIKK